MGFFRLYNQKKFGTLTLGEAFHSFMKLDQHEDPRFDELKNLDGDKARMFFIQVFDLVK